MKKRILSMLLALAMLLSLMPTVTLVGAADTHTSHSGWTALNQSNIASHMTLSDGSYYLSGDVQISGTLTINGTVNLCLNGHVLQHTGSEKVIHVNSGKTLNLYDCGSTAHYFKEGENSRWVYQSSKDSNTKHTVNGGIITSSNDFVTGVYSFGTVTINGGTIVGCSAFNKADNGGNGGGVYNFGTVTMNGGGIKGCVASWGAGFYNAEGCTFNMNGGSITDCMIPSKGACGGGVFAWGTVNMTGGSIERCTANYGGGIQSHDKTVNMTGGSITGCVSRNNGGGINAVAVKLGGTAVVEGNTGEGKPENVYLENNKTIQLASGTDAPAAGMHVGVTRGNAGAFTSNNAQQAYTAYFFADDIERHISFKGNALQFCEKSSLVAVAEKPATCCEYGVGTDCWQCSECKKFFSDQRGTTEISAADLIPPTGLHDWQNHNGFCAVCDYQCEHEGQTGEICEICGASAAVHSCNDGTTFATMWASKTGLPTKPGSYFLTENVTLPATWTVPVGTISLCLNGHMICLADGKNSSVITIPEGATLNLYDCDSEPSAYKFNATNATWAYQGAWSGTDTESSTVKKVTGGIITSINNSCDIGGGVCVLNGGTFNMNGGTIVGCKANWGGGIQVCATSSFTMKGGTVAGCATNNGGGGINADYGFTIENGTVLQCQSFDGGGIRIASGAKAEIKNCTISGCIATSGGGAIACCNNGSAISLSGGKIFNNEATNSTNGGGICAWDRAEVTVTGGEIFDNIAGCGGGIFHDGNQLNLGGTAVVEGNTHNGAKNNVYLKNSKQLNLCTGTDAPAAGMHVGVTRDGNSGTIASSNAQQAYTAYFFADSDAHHIKYNSGTLVFETHSKGTFHSAVSATCTVTGTIAYYDCTGCSEKLDANAKTLDSIIAQPAFGHSFTAQGATLYANCKNSGCPLAGSSLQLTLGEDGTLSDEEVAAWVNAGLAVPEIVYSGNTASITSGDATASVAIPEGTLTAHSVKVLCGTGAVGDGAATNYLTDVLPGTKVTLTAGSYADKAFEEWSGKVNIAEPNAETVTFTMPNEDVTVEAKFLNCYALSVFDGTTLTSEPQVETHNVTVTAPDKAGMEFIGWSAEGLDISGKEMDKTLSFKMPSNRVMLTASYDTPYNVTVVGGTASHTTAFAGTEITLTAPDDSDDRRFVGWSSDDGIEFADATSRITTFIMPAKDVKATAQAEQSYTVTVIGGTATAGVNGKGKAFAGTEITVQASIQGSEEFKGWSGEGVTFADPDAVTTTFTMPKANVVVTANKTVVVTPPTASQNTYTYNGVLQQYRFASSGDSAYYTVTGDRQSQAGTHTVTVSLKPGAVWSDGTTADKTYPFVINPYEIPKPQAYPTTYTYSENEQTFILCQQRNNSYYYYYSCVPTGSYTVTGDKQTNAGSQTVTVTPNPNFCWEGGATTPVEFTFTIKPYPVPKPRPDPRTFTDNGNAQTYTPYVLIDGKTYDLSGYFYTLENRTQTLPGLYFVKATPNDNFCWEDGSTDTLTFTFQILENALECLIFYIEPINSDDLTDYVSLTYKEGDMLSWYYQPYVLRQTVGATNTFYLTEEPEADKNKAMKWDEVKMSDLKPLTTYYIFAEVEYPGYATYTSKITDCSCFTTSDLVILESYYEIKSYTKNTSTTRGKGFAVLSAVTGSVNGMMAAIASPGEPRFIEHTSYELATIKGYDDLNEAAQRGVYEIEHGYYVTDLLRCTCEGEDYAFIVAPETIDKIKKIIGDTGKKKSAVALYGELDSSESAIVNPTPAEAVFDLLNAIDEKQLSEFPELTDTGRINNQTLIDLFMDAGVKQQSETKHKVSIQKVLYDPQSSDPETVVIEEEEATEYQVAYDSTLPAEAIENVEGYTFSGFYYKGITDAELKEKADATGDHGLLLTQGLTKWDPETDTVTRDTELWAVYVKTGSKEPVEFRTETNLLGYKDNTATIMLPAIFRTMQYGDVTNPNTDYFTVDESHKQDGYLTLKAQKDFEADTEPLTFTVKVVESGSDAKPVEDRVTYNIICTVMPVLHAHTITGYTVSDDKASLTATCTGEDCFRKDNKITVTLTAGDAVAGQAYTCARLNLADALEAGLTAGDITYYVKGSSEQLPTAPSEAGQYTAKVTLSDGNTDYILEDDFSLIGGFAGAYLTIENDISVNFVVKKAGYGDSLPTVTYSIDGVAKPEVTAVESGEYYVFRLTALDPSQLGAKIEATLNWKGEKVAEHTYSIATYCYNKLDDATQKSNTFKNLLVDLLNYGAEAQKYLKPETAEKDLCNYKLSDAQKDRAKQIPADLSEEVVQDIPDPSVTASVIWGDKTLVLGSTVAIRCYIEGDGTGLTGKVLNGPDNVLQAGALSHDDHGYYIEYAGLPAANMRDYPAFAVYNADKLVSTYRLYSPAAYAAETLDSAAEYWLVIAMLNYGDSANAYWNEKNP